MINEMKKKKIIVIVICIFILIIGCIFLININNNNGNNTFNYNASVSKIEKSKNELYELEVLLDNQYVDKYEYSIDNGKTFQKSNKFEINENNNYIIVAKDKQGNIYECGTYIFNEIDNEKPNIINTLPSIVYIGTNIHTSNFISAIDSGSGIEDIIITPEILDISKTGFQTIEVVAEDKMGNVAKETYTIRIVNKEQTNKNENPVIIKDEKQEKIKEANEYVSDNTSSFEPVIKEDVTPVIDDKKEIKYNISYDLNGGIVSNNKINKSEYSNKTETFTLNNPTKKGYTFIGWTGSNGMTPNKNVVIKTGSSGNKNYIANWEIVNYNITYELNGGKLASSNPNTYNVNSNFTLNNPTKEGYNFKGWTGSDIKTASTSVQIKKGSIGDKKYTANYTKIKITGISLNKTTLTLFVDSSETITAQITPKTALNEITWSSSNTAVAKVNSSGKITGIKSGTATITAMATNNESVKATINVTVKNKIAVTSIKLISNKKDIDRIIGEVGDTYSISSEIVPTNATNKTVTYSSSDTSIATVDNLGNITIIKEGSAIIKAKADGKTDSINLYATPKGDKIHFIDVEDRYVKESNGTCKGIHSSGDAIVLESRIKVDGEYQKVYAMIDTGHDSSWSYNRVIKYLNDLNIRELQWVIITHDDSDHYGGLKHIKDSGVKIKALYSKSNYADLSKKSLTEGMNISLGNFNLELYNTKLTTNDNCSDGNSTSNATSIAAFAIVNKRSIYFPGDIIDCANKSSIHPSTDVADIVKKRIKDEYNNSKILNNYLDVYKASHHGKSDNNPEYILDYFLPRKTTIDSGKATPSYVINPGCKSYVSLKFNPRILNTYGSTYKNGHFFHSGNGSVIVNIKRGNSIGDIYVLQQKSEGINSKDEREADGCKISSDI